MTVMDAQDPVLPTSGRLSTINRDTNAPLLFGIMPLQIIASPLQCLLLY
jgi:hypothetical protein